MLVDREKEIAGDLIDLLLSFSDFDEFKDMMLSYRNTNKYNDLPSKFSDFVLKKSVLERNTNKI